jgi:hypothetical protein
MTTQTPAIGATVDAIGAAQARAVDDLAFATLLKQAGKAGAIIGAGTNAKAATAFFSDVADSIFKPAAVILGLRNRDDGLANADTLPTADAAPLLLLQLCGLVNHAIEQAQTEARRSAIQRMKAAEISKAAKNARNALVTKLDRSLAPYGVTVNFSAGTCAVRELADVETDSEKALKRLVSAFALNLSGALDGLAALDAQTWVYVVGRVSALSAERDAESARENAEGLAEAALKMAERVAALAGTSDLVSLANAQREADEAQTRAKAARAKADKLIKALAA